MARIETKVKWDPHQFYEETAEQLEANRKKALRRQELKSEWQRRATNPFKAGGHVLSDPAITRFYSLRLFSHGQFRPQMARTMLWFSTVLIPLLGGFYLLSSSAYKKEEMYRTGQVAYADRTYKLF